MKDIMALKSIGIDLFKSIINESKENPDLLDSYSLNQFKSKENLLHHISKLELINPNITIFGSWYGSILIPALVDQAEHMTCIDIDERVIAIAKNRLFKKYKNIDFICSDVFNPLRDKRIINADLIINTSCEHMTSMKELKYLYKSNAYFAFQSNNMYDIPTHTNCVSSIDEFALQLPDNATIIAKDEVEDDRGIRYTLIGKLCAE
jgi:SAM-dependent methyltransferase